MAGLAVALMLIARAVAEIGTGAEGLAGGAQHDGAAGVVFTQRLAGGGQLADQFEIEEIMGRALDLHHRHMVLDGDAQFRIIRDFHNTPPTQYFLLSASYPIWRAIHPGATKRHRRR